jgi:hypothetical protein
MFAFARKMLACAASFRFTAFQFHNSRRSLRRQPSTLRQSDPFDKQERAKQRIALFRSLFRGREDVYARRWERDGKGSGYSPAAVKDWKAINRGRPEERKKIDRKTRRFLPVTDAIIEDHLLGKETVGGTHSCQTKPAGSLRLTSTRRPGSMTPWLSWRPAGS